MFWCLIPILFIFNQTIPIKVENNSEFYITLRWTINFWVCHWRYYWEKTDRTHKEVWTSMHQAEERSEAKGKGKRERYMQLKADFQGLARRDKKALNEQCKQRKTKECLRLAISSRKLEIQGNLKLCPRHLWEARIGIGESTVLLLTSIIWWFDGINTCFLFV